MICGKVIYQTRQSATDTLKGINNDSRCGRSNVQPSISYFCTDCQGWHVSSAQQKRPKIKSFKNSTETINTTKKDIINKNYVVHNRHFKIK